MKKLILLLAISFLMAFKQTMRTHTFILIHGAGHGAWAWKKVLPLLEAKGQRGIALDLPSHGQDKTSAETVTLDSYVQKVVDVATAQAGPVILVGHSSGGVTIAQAAEKLGMGKVEKLVFLDAFLPRNGESVFLLAGKFAPPTMSGPLSSETMFTPSTDGKTVSFNMNRVSYYLYHDCSAEDVAFAKANLGKQPIAPLATPVQLTDTVYGAIPKYYILCTQAQDWLKQEMAKNVPTRRIDNLPASHSPFFSQPQKLADLLMHL